MTCATAALALTVREVATVNRLVIFWLLAVQAPLVRLIRDKSPSLRFFSLFSALGRTNHAAIMALR